MQLICSSQPFGYDELTLVGISAAARRNNARDGITGAVICRADLLVQLLGGIFERLEPPEAPRASLLWVARGLVRSRLDKDRLDV